MVLPGELKLGRSRHFTGRRYELWRPLAPRRSSTAMKVLVRALKTDPEDAACTKKVIGAILADHREAG
jgi:hypothetical protein